jgi:hypothetical protein
LSRAVRFDVSCSNGDEISFIREFQGFILKCESRSLVLLPSLPLEWKDAWESAFQREGDLSFGQGLEI